MRHCNISMLFGFLLQDAGCRGVFYSGGQKLCRQERGGKLEGFLFVFNRIALCKKHWNAFFPSVWMQVPLDEKHGGVEGGGGLECMTLCLFACVCMCVCFYVCVLCMCVMMMTLL